ncbi:MAG: class I SAM-dependent methyltransferase [Candidatus Promineifilaceae bacterium]
MHPKLLYFRYKLFRYRAIEQTIARSQRRLLDIGCGDGENMLRFQQPHLDKVGIEVSFPRLVTAQTHGLKVQQASGTQLPFADDSFDMVYVAHVLHHVEAYKQVLAEIKRVSSAETPIFIIETVTDHPALRLARKLHPVWQGDEVEADWRYGQLRNIFEEAGFTIKQSGRYNVIFFLWEMFPLAFWPFELFTPLFIYLDLFFARFFSNWSAHCYFELTHGDTP